MRQGSSWFFVGLLCSLLGGCGSGKTDGNQQQIQSDRQDDQDGDAESGAQGQTPGFAAYVPADGVMVVDLKVEKMLKKLGQEDLRPEKTIEYAKEQTSIDANDVESMAAVLMPEDVRVLSRLLRQEFLFASIIRFKQEIDPEKVLPLPPDKTLDVSIAGKKCRGYSNHALKGMHAIVVYWVDKKTVIVGPQARVEKMVAETAGTGPLARNAAAIDTADHFSVLVAIDPIRDELAGLLDKVAGQGDPELQKAANALKKVDTLTLGVNFSEDPMAELKLVGSDAGALGYFAAEPKQLIELLIAMQQFSARGVERAYPKLIELVQPLDGIKVEKADNTLILRLPQPEGYWNE